jgi:hypothetical protein
MQVRGNVIETPRAWQRVAKIRSPVPDAQKRHFAYMFDAPSMSFVDRAAFIRNEWVDAY